MPGAGVVAPVAVATSWLSSAVPERERCDDVEAVARATILIHPFHSVARRFDSSLPSLQPAPHCLLDKQETSKKKHHYYHHHRVCGYYNHTSSNYERWNNGWWTRTTTNVILTMPQQLQPPPQPTPASCHRRRLLPTVENPTRGTTYPSPTTRLPTKGCRRMGCHKHNNLINNRTTS